MKLTSINARVDRAGIHNDRNFDYEYAEHINAEKTPKNKVWNHTGNNTLTFRQAELAFYEQHFSEYLDKINQKYLSWRQPGNTKTMEEYYASRQSRPEDRIIQIGRYNDGIDPDELWAIATQYRNMFNKVYSPNCTIISMALHVDEETPHIHIRRVWTATDKDGLSYVNQKDALKELGFLNPAEGRFNNAKVDFTREDRQLLYQISKEYCYDIGIDRPEKKKHLDTRTFKFREDAERESRISAMLKELSEREASCRERETCLDHCLDRLIGFYLDSGLFEDEEELESLKKATKYEMAVQMHDLFMQRIGTFSGREQDICR